MKTWKPSFNIPWQRRRRVTEQRLLRKWLPSWGYSGEMYQVEFTPLAESDLASLDRPTGQRVLLRLRWLAENLDITTPESLSGRWKGVFKLRIGDYRALYTFNRSGRSITVHLVRHRREVYKTR